MAFTVPPLIITDVAHADAARALEQLRAADAFRNLVQPENWLLLLLAYRAAGSLTLRGSLVLARHIIRTNPSGGLSRAWPLLAAVECLGQVDTASLTPACLARLLQQAYQLAYGVFIVTIATPTQLRAAVASRKSIVGAACGDSSSPWLTFLDRIGDALTPVLGERVIT